MSSHGPPPPQDKPQDQEAESKMRIICRLDFWGREIKGKFFRDPQAPQNPYRLIVAQCCTKQIGKFWGCCPQAGARVLEITETHFQEQQAGDVWDLYLMNSMPTPENQVFHNFMLLPKSQQYIDTTRKMSEERWQFLGSINASMARMDLENLLKSFLEPNENLEFHSSHAHMLIMMDKATDRPEVRKIKENRQMQKLKKHTTSKGSATDRSSTGASTASSSSVHVDGTESIGASASTSTTVAAASSVHRPKPETSQTSSTKRVAPSPTTLTTVGSLDSSESPSIATQVSAFSSFQPPSSHNYGQSQSHQRSVNNSGASRRPASKQQQPRAYHLQDPLEMMTGVMADMNLKSQPTTTILPLPSHHPPSYNYHPYYAAPLPMAHADPYGYAPPHVGHYHPHHLSSASSSYPHHHHHHPTSASTTSMLLNHHHHHLQHQHAYAMDPWTVSAQQQQQQQQQQVDAATFYQQHHSLTTTATTAMIHPTIPLAPHHNSGLYEYYPPPTSSPSPTPPSSFSLSVVDHHSNSNANNHYSPASTPTTIVPKTPSPEASGSDSTESTASTTPPGQSSSSAAEAAEAEEEQREEQSSGEQLASVILQD